MLKSNMPYLFLFIFGAVQFYTVFFLSKFVDYSLVTHFTLLTISICHLTSAWVTTWMQRFRYFMPYFNLLYPLAFAFLSQTGLRSSILFICLAIFTILAVLQFQIFDLFTRHSDKFKTAYGFELSGVICGVVGWYFFSSYLGFIKFAVLCLFIQLLYAVLTLDKKIILLTFVFTVVGYVNISEPTTVGNKRERYELAAKAIQPTLRFWDPNGHVELIEYPPEQKSDLNYLLFEGGQLRSNIYQFDGDYNSLRNDYENSLARGVWGLDVVLPHFIMSDKNNCALISAMGGQEILSAKAFSCRKIFAIDINKSGQKIMLTQQKNFSGNLYSDNVVPVHQDGRLFVHDSNETFDLIQIYSAHNASYSGALGPEMQASSLFTAEALQEYYAKLSEDGILHITQPYFKKIYSTFKQAFGKNFLQQRQLFVIERQNMPDGLVSFYYKKQPWTESEINKIYAWLGKDHKHKWVTLIDPIQNNFSDESIENTNGYQARASTDNWPFSKLTVSPTVYTGVQLAIGLLLFICIVVVFSGFKQKDFLNLGLLFLMGITFAANQFLNIYLSQKVFGNPAFGLMSGTTLTLLACFAGVQLSRVGLPNRIFVALGLVLVSTFVLMHFYFYQQRVVQIMLLDGLVVLQSALFTQLIILQKENLRFNFWINACGLFVGMILANLIFVFSGYRAILLSLMFAYLVIFLMQLRSRTSYRLS